MIIRKLSKDQVSYIYKTYMVNDFPANELKPLSMILKGMENNVFEGLGLMSEDREDKILGYAIFVKNGKDYLFDYLAVVDGNRNDGIGSTFLKHIAEYLKDADSVIGEVEDPDYAKNEAEKQLQERRIGFYKRNGYIDTNVKVKLYGVDFRVFELDLGRKHSEKEIKRLYKSVYKKTFPKFMYYKYVKVKR